MKRRMDDEQRVRVRIGPVTGTKEQGSEKIPNDFTVVRPIAGTSQRKFCCYRRRLDDGKEGKLEESVIGGRRGVVGL